MGKGPLVAALKNTLLGAFSRSISGAVPPVTTYVDPDYVDPGYVD